MDLKNLMAQAQQMQQRAQQVEEALLQLSVTGCAGGESKDLQYQGRSQRCSGRSLN